VYVDHPLSEITDDFDDKFFSLIQHLEWFSFCQLFQDPKRTTIRFAIRIVTPPIQSTNGSPAAGRTGTLEEAE